ncbi:hypothetical protein AHAS_Ahas20G0249700 [Arachis hypogaea]
MNDSSSDYQLNQDELDYCFESNQVVELNLLDGGCVVQSNFSHYHGHIMNYQFRDSREYDKFFDVYVKAFRCFVT